MLLIFVAEKSNFLAGNWGLINLPDKYVPASRVEQAYISPFHP